MASCVQDSVHLCFPGTFLAHSRHTALTAGQTGAPHTNPGGGVQVLVASCMALISDACYAVGTLKPDALQPLPLHSVSHSLLRLCDLLQRTQNSRRWHADDSRCMTEDAR